MRGCGVTIADVDAETLIDQWEAAWSGRDLAAFRKVCVGDLHYEDPLTPKPLLELESFERQVRSIWRGFPDIRLEAAGPRLTDGQHLSAPFRAVGTHRGRIGGIPPSGNTLSLHLVCFCELRHGLLARVRAFYDLNDAQIQLGVAPEPGSPAERAMRLVMGFGVKVPRVPGLFPGRK